MMIDIKKIETSQAPKTIGPYSQAVYAAPFLFISGQLPVDPINGKVVSSDIQLQIKQVLDNLEAILKASHYTFENIVRYEIFVIDLNHFAIINRECAKRLTQPILPARQTVQVARLPLDALVEISCIAMRS